MENFQKIHIEGKEYFIIDSIQNLRAEDSFIYRKNKLQMYKGNGESRKYVGSYLGSSGERLSDFFEYENWGKGIVFINGRNLGRFWKVGPQQTLYLPGVWLKKGKNEIIVFDQLNETIKNSISTIKTPILDNLKN